MKGRIRLIIPTKENYTEMTPTEFEQHSLSFLKSQFEAKQVENFSLKHNVKIETDDGNYQIDGEMRFIVAGVEIITLIECKKYKGPIKRTQIQVLYDNIRSIGAHKGIFITTSYYQSGALAYAKQHGIALISIVDGKYEYETRSVDCIDKFARPSWLENKPYIMAMQTQRTDTSVSVSYIDKTDELYKFIIKEVI